MELKLSQGETKAMLLESIDRLFPGKFNTVTLSDFSTYSSRGTAEFTFDEPTRDPDPVIVIPAPPSANGES